MSVYLMEGVRTPIGSFLGSLKTVSALAKRRVETYFYHCHSTDEDNFIGVVPILENMLGDFNQDDSVDVLDIVMVVDLILYNEDPSEYELLLGDINSDGAVNVIDIVMIADIILGDDLSRGVPTDQVRFNYGNGSVSYESDGSLAGMQFEVTGQYEITGHNLPTGWEIHNNENTIILFSLDGSSLEDKTLFEYDGDIVIQSAIATDWYGSDIAVSSVLIPKEFALQSAYPNPFNPVTNLKFGLPVDSKVSIQIYNLQGQVVSTLLNDNMQAGDGDDVLEGGPGDDYANGGNGNDTYLWSPGDGNDLLDDPSGTDVLVMGGDITAEDVRFTVSRDNLELHVGEETIIVNQQYRADYKGLYNNQIETVIFDNGDEIDIVDPKSLFNEHGSLLKNKDIGTDHAIVIENSEYFFQENTTQGGNLEESFMLAAAATFGFVKKKLHKFSSQNSKKEKIMKI